MTTNTRLRRLTATWLALTALFVLAPAAASVPPGARTAPARPDPDGTPTRVTVGIFVLDVIEIDDPSQEFTADIFWRLQWRDERLALAGREGGSQERVMPISEIWTPGLTALNRREVTALLPEVARVDAQGTVTYEQRVFGTFGARLDLREFPADTQTLEARVVSYHYSPQELGLEIDPKSGMLPEPSIVGWRLEAGEPELEPLVVLGAVRDFAGLTFRLRAERETAHYVLSVAIPLLLIAGMAWSVFWIPPQFLPSQTSVSTASVFTLIAFRFSVKLSLPEISYLTLADQFVLAVTFLVFGALATAIVTGRLAKTGREEQANTIDRWARWIYLAAFLFIAYWGLA